MDTKVNLLDKEVKLNKQQKKAVSFGKGPLLVIAGAGTGKTAVIIERIKHLILGGLVQTQEVLALTFSEKAAREMEERVDVAMPYGYTQMWISTFHSFCDRVLRERAFHIGLDPRYKLLTEAEAVRFFRKHLFDFELQYFRPLGNPNKFISGILQHFSRLKDEDVSSNDYLAWAKKQEGDNLEAAKWTELAKAYQKYEELKIQNSLVDYADLISNVLKLFRERSNVLREYQDKFKYILVDEFQDTNIAQNELIKLLVNKDQNLTVVADDDQSIYAWRGAAVSNVVQFRKSFPETKVISLTQNYRSTQNILDSAYRLIQFNNPNRLEVKESINKKLTAVSGKKGEEVEFIHADRVENEAELVAQKIIDIAQKEKRQFSDFAILVRANNHADSFIRAFARAGISYQFLGPGQLFQQTEIKELIAYLKILYNFEDSVSFYKVLTINYFDLSARDLLAITNYARKYNLSLFETAEKINDLAVNEETKKTVGQLVDLAKKHMHAMRRETAGQILYSFLAETGMLKAMVDLKSFEDEKRAQNIAKFFDKIKSFDVEHEDASVFAVVDWVDLCLELGESPLASDFDWVGENAVNILTTHSSKGLEFPVVFVVNLVSQRFPTIERRDMISIPEDLVKEYPLEGDWHLEEERRLFYVALTRAKERVYLTAADYYGEGKREKKISQFVAETLGEKVLTRAPQDAGNGGQVPIFAANTKTSENKPKPYLINYLSYSRIECFRFCPLHYKLRYIYNLPTSPSAALSLGNTIHLTLKQFNDLLMQKQNPKKDKLYELFLKNWIREGYSSKSHEEKMKVRGEEYLSTYLKGDLYNPDAPPVAIELPFSFRVDRLKVSGKIDRIDKTSKGIEIIDYKTTDFSAKEVPTQKELAKNLQLSMYALAAEKTRFPFLNETPEEVILSLYFLDNGMKVSTTRTGGELEKATQEILEVKQQIETSDFACSGGFFCKNCEYKLFCEVKN